MGQYSNKEIVTSLVSILQLQCCYVSLKFHTLKSTLCYIKNSHPFSLKIYIKYSITLHLANLRSNQKFLLLGMTTLGVTGRKYSIVGTVTLCGIDMFVLHW